MHSSELLEATPKMRKTIMNYIVHHRKQINIVDLQGINPTSNKENLPLALDP